MFVTAYSTLNLQRCRMQEIGVFSARLIAHEFWDGSIETYADFYADYASQALSPSALRPDSGHALLGRGAKVFLTISVLQSKAEPIRALSGNSYRRSFWFSIWF